MTKRFVDQPLPGFNFKSYLLVKYDGFFPDWMPSARELDEERRVIMQIYDKHKKQAELKKWKAKRARYNTVMKEWARQQR